MKRFRFFEADGGANPTSGTGGTILSGSASPAPSNPAPSQSTPWTWADESGKFSADWRDKLPADLKDNESLKVIGTLPDLVKSYVHTKGMVGKKLEMPGDGATPEQVAAWRKTVGAPDTLEGYLGESKTLRPDSVPEAVWNADAEKAFLAVAHKHHLSPAAVKDIVAMHGDALKGALESSKVDYAALVASEAKSLREKWGGEFDANVALATRIAEKLSETMDLELTDPIFQSAKAVEAFAQMGKLISEGRLVKGTPGGVDGAASDRMADFTDPKSQSRDARDYRGENGPEKQQLAAAEYRRLLAAKMKQK